jgi:hypothetical protein
LGTHKGGEGDGVLLELMGPGGVGIVVQTSVDRSKGKNCSELVDLRKLIAKYDGKLGQ